MQYCRGLTGFCEGLSRLAFDKLEKGGYGDAKADVVRLTKLCIGSTQTNLQCREVYQMSWQWSLAGQGAIGTFEGARCWSSAVH